MVCQCSSSRKHTPIVSKKQRGLFGAEYNRRKRGLKRRIPGITTEELKSHLEESAGKKLPVRSRNTNPTRNVLKRIRRRKQ